MNIQDNQLYAKESEVLQISYREYRDLMGSSDELQRLHDLKSTVINNLQSALEGTGQTIDELQEEASPSSNSKPEPAKVLTKETAEEEIAQMRESIDEMQIPPIKKDISNHFNKLDESGRLFNVFKQYYMFLNDSCGGTVRVTMKDGFCSFWNYDEWEEFSFVDIFENTLRVAVDPRYTDALESLSLCEVPRLLSSRRNLICVKVDDLNNTVLKVLTKAFNEVGLKTK